MTGPGRKLANPYPPRAGRLQRWIADLKAGQTIQIIPRFRRKFQLPQGSRTGRIGLQLSTNNNTIMGAQWKQKWRELTSNKKGQVVGKLVREIQVAVQQGGVDPDMNPRLYAALEKARKNSVTRETIERAIKTGSGQGGEKAQLETVIYEGFTPHKIPVMVEALTDNRNRTGPEIRTLFKTGALGTPGSVGFFFEHMGVVEAVHPEPNREAEDDAIEAGAQNVEELDAEEIPEGHTGATFLTDPKELAAVSKALAALGWKLQASELRYLAKTFPELTEAQQEEVGAFLSALDDHSDVHRVYAAVK